MKARSEAGFGNVTVSATTLLNHDGHQEISIGIEGNDRYFGHFDDRSPKHSWSGNILEQTFFITIHSDEDFHSLFIFVHGNIEKIEQW